MVPCDLAVIDAEAQPVVRSQITATPTDVRRALRDIRRKMRATGLMGENLNSLELVFAELLNNVVEHAYCGGGAGRIGFSITACGDGFHCRLRDTGAPMTTRLAAMGQAASVTTPRSDLPEGGFGWLLIRRYARNLVYRRTGNLNTLTFRIQFAKPDPKPLEFNLFKAFGSKTTGNVAPKMPQYDRM